MNASLCKLLILRVVCEEPMHGYGIIRRLAALTKNLCVPTQGTVYPVLQEFERCGCVRSRAEMTGKRERKVHEATPKGRQALAAGMDVWRRCLAHLQEVIRESARTAPRASMPGESRHHQGRARGKGAARAPEMHG